MTKRELMRLAKANCAALIRVSADARMGDLWGELEESLSEKEKDEFTNACYRLAERLQK